MRLLNPSIHAAEGAYQNRTGGRFRLVSRNHATRAAAELVTPLARVVGADIVTRGAVA